MVRHSTYQASPTNSKSLIFDSSEVCVFDIAHFGQTPGTLNGRATRELEWQHHWTHSRSPTGREVV